MSRFRWLEFEQPDKGGKGPDGMGGPARPLFDSDTAGIDLTDPAQVLKLADELYRKFEYERALKYYSKVLSLDPNIEEGWAGQLRCLLDLGENPEALTWAEKAQKLFPKSADVISARALALSRQGQAAEAIAFSDGAMKNDRLSWYPWLVRGEILALTQGANAEFCLMKALECLPNDWLVSAKVAQALARTPLIEKSLPHFRKALSLKADVAELWYEFGAVQEKLGFPEEALKSFGRAEKLVPHNRKYSTATAAVVNANPIQRLIGFLKSLWK